jgi:TetR/AcrR family transcriptional regulator, regulator of cefoperazone and chloramphenicol sensitivity
MSIQQDQPDSSSPRERILSAVIDCIEQDGINNLTTRSIAHLAGTNIASINYYFRSKDALVAEALQLSLNHMLADIQALLDDRQRSLQESLGEVFLYLIDGTVRFPRVSMAHLFSALVEQQYDSLGAQAVRQIFEWIVTRLSEAYPQKDPAALRAVLYQVISAILFTMLAPGFFQSAMPIDFNSAGDRLAFVGYLSKTLQASLAAV